MHVIIDRTIDTFKWHKQSEDDILFAIDDWEYHTFACIMKDGKLVKFSGLHDETYDGKTTTHIDCIKQMNRENNGKLY